MDKSAVLKDLGDGLILRRSTAADTEAVGNFQARIHAENDAHFDETILWWIRDLMSGRHPTFGQDDFTIVEDTSTGKIVSSLCLINQTWTYDGIPFKVGRPEVVATEPEYRNRGLVRAQFDLIHRLSVERGQFVQAITGIPYYYRVFGYEQGALDMESGWRVYEHQLPKPDQTYAEPVAIRPAQPADIPLIMQLYAQQTAREAVACLRTEADWAYQFQASEMNCERERIAILTAPTGSPVGMLIYANEIWGDLMPVFSIEIIPGCPWMDACRAALPFLWKEGRTLSDKVGADFNVLALWFGREHPAYQAMPGRLTRQNRNYGMYIRVPDLPGFLSHIRPALEKRLSTSVAAGYSGELKVSLYRSLLTFKFDHGRMLPVEQLPEVNAKSGAAFPDLTFLRLLFGANSLEELQGMFPDVIVESTTDARPLLNALFPKRQSNVMVLS
jgi:hypothetical protein